jgi:hypothetical protein
MDIHFTAEGWGGLEKGGAFSLLDGTVSTSNYWYAVGSSEVHGSGIPGPGSVESQVELWVLSPAPLLDSTVVDQVGGCFWTAGDGTGGTESLIGTANSQEECSALVMSAEPTANGATLTADLSAAPGSCYAEFGMT